MNTRTLRDPLLTSKQVDDYTGGVLSELLLRTWRCNGRHRNLLHYKKIGSLVYYQLSVIDSFLESCDKTSENLT